MGVQTSPLDVAGSRVAGVDYAVDDLSALGCVVAESGLHAEEEHAVGVGEDAAGSHSHSSFGAGDHPLSGNVSWVKASSENASSENAFLESAWGISAEETLHAC